MSRVYWADRRETLYRNLIKGAEVLELLRKGCDEPQITEVEKDLTPNQKQRLAGFRDRLAAVGRAVSVFQDRNSGDILYQQVLGVFPTEEYNVNVKHYGISIEVSRTDFQRVKERRNLENAIVGFAFLYRDQNGNDIPVAVYPRGVGYGMVVKRPEIDIEIIPYRTVKEHEEAHMFDFALGLIDGTVYNTTTGEATSAFCFPAIANLEKDMRAEAIAFLSSRDGRFSQLEHTSCVGDYTVFREKSRDPGKVLERLEKIVTSSSDLKRLTGDQTISRGDAAVYRLFNGEVDLEKIERELTRLDYLRQLNIQALKRIPDGGEVRFAAVVRNIPFNKIYKRLPEIVKTVKREHGGRLLADRYVPRKVVGEKVQETLKSYGIEKVTDILSLTDGDLSALPGISASSVRKIKSFLDEYGLTLGMDIDIIKEKTGKEPGKVILKRPLGYRGSQLPFGLTEIRRAYYQFDRELGIRDDVFGILGKMGIKDIKDLARSNKEQVASQKGIGDKSVHLLDELLGAYDLTFDMSEEELEKWYQGANVHKEDNLDTDLRYFVDEMDWDLLRRCEVSQIKTVRDLAKTSEKDLTRNDYNCESLIEENSRLVYMGRRFLEKYGLRLGMRDYELAESPMEKIEKPINEGFLDLPVGSVFERDIRSGRRVLESLRKAGVKTVKDLIILGDGGVQEAVGGFLLSERAIFDINDILYDNGLRLGMDVNSLQKVA